MKLRNLLSPTSNKRSWQLLDPSKFKEIYTFKTASGLRANSGCLFERIGNMLADQLKVEVEIIDLYLDLDKAIRVDENKKMLYTFENKEELLLSIFAKASANIDSLLSKSLAINEKDSGQFTLSSRNAKIDKEPIINTRFKKVYFLPMIFKYIVGQNWNYN